MVVKLASEMEERLRFHDTDRGPTGWMEGDYTDTMMFLMGRLMTEIGEMMRAINTSEGPNSVWLEAADAANFIGMLADRYARESEA